MDRSLSRSALLARAAAAAASAGIIAQSGGPALAQTAPLGPTLEKIKNSGTFSVGARQEAFPFGFVQGSNWMGFSTEIAREMHDRVQKELNAKLELKLVPVTGATRIALLQNGTVDLDAGSTVHTLGRDMVVDFSIPFFVTSTEIIVPKSGPVKTMSDLAGKKLGLPQGSLDIDLYRRLNDQKHWPQPVQVVTYQDQADGFQALLNGAVNAYGTDGVLLAGMQAKAKNPSDYTIINPRFNVSSYAFAMRQNDSRFRHLINATFVDLFEGPGYMKLWDKYFGPKGVLPLPMSEDLKAMIAINSWPK